MSKPIIKIESVISAPVEKVWSYWTNPSHITNWNFASPDWCCPTASNDLQVGGRYSARMEAKDGSFGFDFEATYNEVVGQKRLTYTIADGRKVTTNFEQKGGSTKVTTEFEAEGQNPLEMQKNGWQSILDNFKAYTENN